MFGNPKSLFRENRIFVFLAIYRWASLLPALLILNTAGRSEQTLPPLLVFGIAFLANLTIFLVNRPLNKLVIAHPVFLGIDIIFSAGILAVSGGANSPYYLYALSPLLAGAFFFQMRGALIVSSIFTPLYLLSSYFGSQTELVALITQFAGIWLIPILFAYPSTLLKDINQTQEELTIARDELTQKHENLATAHRQLEIIHDLTVLLQAAPDLISVQERVL